MLSLALTERTWAHRLPAGAKFAVLALAMTGAAFLDNVPALALLLALTAALYLSLGRHGARVGARSLRPVLWIVGFIGIWQIVFGDPWGGLVLALRIFVMVGLANFVTLTTPLPEMMAVIERLARPFARFGLPPRLPALAVAMTLRLIPVLEARLAALRMAWRARSPKRPGPRLIAPLALSLLDDSERLAEALRARGGLVPPRPEAGRRR